MAAIQRDKLVVVDEEDLLAEIGIILSKGGFRVSTVPAADAGVSAILEENPALLVVEDVGRRSAGVSLCRAIKRDPRTRGIPVVLVSDKISEEDVQHAFQAGADDYLKRPFRVRELVARVKAILRRGQRAEERRASDWIVLEGLEIDRLGYRILVDGSPVTFTAMEFRLLELLALHPGRVFTREDIVRRILGSRLNVSGRNVDVHIVAIRRKLRGRKDLIETVRGVGYRFRSA